MMKNMKAVLKLFFVWAAVYDYQVKCRVTCYSVLYCIVLYCIVLYCIVLYCIVLYCIVLRYGAVSCAVIYSAQYSIVQYNTVH